MASSANQETSLFMFIKNIHRKTIFKESHFEINDITSCVNAVVKKIIPLETRFQIQNFIHVGSSFDRSRILSPNEFDFMLILQEFQEEVIRLTRGCQPGMKTIRLQNFERGINPKGPNIIFNSSMKLELWSDLSEEKHKELKELVIEAPTGKLIFKDLRRYSLNLQWIKNYHESDVLDISVDMMPCIAVNPSCKEIDKDMKICPSKLKTLAFKDGCFLVGKFCVIDGICWQLSFAATERHMVKSLSSGHLKIFRTLKYMFVEKSIIGICDLMSSYILKTATLNHCYFDCNGNGTPGECLIAILNSISKNMNVTVMNSLFMPTFNLWQTIICERIRNITENDTICDKAVKRTLSHILDIEGNEYKHALTVTVIFEFWKRIFQLFVHIFASAEKGYLERTALINILKIIYIKLNEEDEDDDIDGDYFTESNYEQDSDEWLIKMPPSGNTGDEYNCATVKASVSQEECSENHENDDNKCNDDYDDDDGDDDWMRERENDLEDMEAYQRYVLKEMGEYGSDSDTETTDSETSDHSSEFGNDWTTQAFPDDVYEINDKYIKELNNVDIPVFSQLLEQIRKTNLTGIVEILQPFHICVETDYHCPEKKLKEDKDGNSVN